MTWGHGFRPCWFGAHCSRYVSLATSQHLNSHLTYISMSIDNNKNAGMTVVDLVTWLIVHRQPREILSLCRIGDVKKVEGLSEDTTVAALMDANANDFKVESIMLHSLNAQSVNEVKSSGLSTFPYYSMKEALINWQAECLILERLNQDSCQPSLQLCANHQLEADPTSRQQSLLPCKLHKIVGE